MTADNAISGETLAKSAGEEHEARQEALSFESIKDDIRALLLHMRLIERAPGSETGRDARYYVPESVKKKSAEILPILEQFRGKDLRPAAALLDQIYEEKIKPIIETPAQLPIVKLTGKNAQIGGIDYTHELQRILHYRVYDAQLLADVVADLNLTLKNGVGAFRALAPKRQMEVYNLASLLGLISKLKSCGVNEETFSFAPGSGVSMGNDINTRFSRGYEVSIGSTWSRLKPDDYRAISKIQALNFPTNKASVLNLCGGNGHPLMSIAPAFQNSRLVMVDANSKNISDAMQQMDKIEDSNTYEVKLSDVRSGFGGIPCANQEFDVMTMVGDSEFGMSFDDLCRLMSESMRVLKHNGGLFLIETTHIERYVSALQQVVQENRSAFNFDIGMHQLAEGVFVIVTGKLTDDKKPSEGNPATLLRYIFGYRDGLPGKAEPISRANATMPKDMAKQRGGNDSLSNIYRELGPLEKSGLVEGDKGNPRYLPDWALKLNPEEIIRQNPELESPAPDDQQKQNVGIRVRALRIENLNGKSEEELTPEDKNFIRESAQHFGLYVDSIGKFSHSWSQTIKELYILTRAEVLSIGLSDISPFALSAIDEIGTGFFAHELGHIVDDILELNNLSIAMQKNPHIHSELVKFFNMFEKHLAQNHAWRNILDGWKGLASLSPEVLVSVVDVLIKDIEDINQTRSDIEKYLTEHSPEIGKDISVKYMDEAKKAKGECLMVIWQLRDLKQNILDSRATRMIDINESISNATRPYKNYRDLEFRLELEGNLPLIHGNPVVVSHIWTNFLRNSLDAIFKGNDLQTRRDEGIITIKTRYVLKPDDGFIEILFSDNGCGIPEDLLRDNKLFQKGVTSKLSGTGVGLYLIQQTIEKLGGTIEVRSELGKGTTFTIRLPIAPSYGSRSSAAGATGALKALPQEWHGNDLKVADFLAELSQLLRIENVLNQDKSTFIFSEKVTFDNGLGVLLPKLAKSGMRVAVIATNDRQRALIDELNQGKPEDERIIYADTVADIRTKIHTARYYYFKVTGDPDTDLQGITTFDITEIVKRIIDALGKVSGIVERERLELLHEAARKFAEAA